MFNPLPGIIHQDNHQQMIVQMGVLPFTMRAAMTMCVAFEESIGCKGLTMQRIQQRMEKMAGPYPGHVPGQNFHMQPPAKAGSRYY